ncbi:MULTISPECIES: hypothetical protein [Myroides]|uniref:Uncharacterized protein n=1 Tax=Myroides odoratimimus CIP 101113 TaxID=883154 RepID=A0AAV3F6A6_9FLAO|nr:MULTISPECIES: hypothetical protein [Myroides]EHO14632.1 hypothetical protein HMPREF9715_00517 [Myroides odoratimimus CIP 101113]
MSSISVRNSFEPVGAASSVPVDEYGIRRVKLATGQATSIGGAFDLLGIKEAFTSLFTNNDSPYDFKPMGAAFGGSRGKSHGKGEKGWAAKASGTNNEFKKYKPDPKNPGKTLFKPNKDSEWKPKKAPEGFWEWWNKKRGK